VFYTTNERFCQVGASQKTPSVDEGFRLILLETSAKVSFGYNFTSSAKKLQKLLRLISIKHRHFFNFSLRSSEISLRNILSQRSHY